MRLWRFVFLLALLCRPPGAFAWTPCAPFCDKECGGPALQDLGAQTGSQLLVLSEQTRLSNLRALAALEQQTGRVEIGIDQHATVLADLLSSTAAAVAGFQRAQVLAEAEFRADRDYLPTAFGPALRAGNAAGARRKASAAATQVANRAYRNLMEDLATRDEISRSQAIHTLLSITEELSLSYGCNDCTDAAQQGAALQRAAAVFSLAAEQPGPGQDLATRFRGIVASEVQGLARQVLAEGFATYTPGDDARIPPCLVGRDCSEADEAASVATFLYELPDARLRTEAWARQLTELNPTGLMRERVYLVAEEVALLEHAARLKQSRNALIALVLGGAGTSLALLPER